MSNLLWAGRGFQPVTLIVGGTFRIHVIKLFNLHTVLNALEPEKMDFKVQNNVGTFLLMNLPVDS